MNNIGELFDEWISYTNQTKKIQNSSLPEVKLVADGELVFIYNTLQTYYNC